MIVRAVEIGAAIVEAAADVLAVVEAADEAADAVGAEAVVVDAMEGMAVEAAGDTRINDSDFVKKGRTKVAALLVIQE